MAVNNHGVFNALVLLATLSYYGCCVTATPLFLVFFKHGKKTPIFCFENVESPSKFVVEMVRPEKHSFKNKIITKLYLFSRKLVVAPPIRQ